MDARGMTPVIGPSSLAQGIAPSASGARGLRVPAQLDAVMLGADGSGLWHYRRAQDRPDRDWRRGALISADAVGPGAIVAGRDHPHVLVPEPSGIAHYRASSHDTQAGGLRAALRVVTHGVRPLPLRWQLIGTPLPGRALSATLAGDVLVATTVTDDGVEIWSESAGWRCDDRIPGADAAPIASFGSRLAMLLRQEGSWHLRWRERDGRWATRPIAGVGTDTSAAIAPLGAGWLVAVAGGDRVDTWRVSDDGTIRPDEPLTWGAGEVRALALTPSRLRPGGWLQALTDEDGSVFHHHRQAIRDRGGLRSRWMRHACLRLADHAFTVDPVDSHKLAQISGDVDTQPTADGAPRPTLSRSDSTAGVRGTDLGVRVDHRGESYLLFGDSHWRGRPWLVTRDAISRLTPHGPIPGLPGVRFHGAPVQIDGRGITLREYDVPLDGFSAGGDFFLLATSNHFARFQTMGRSVLARAADPRLPIDPASRRPLRFTALCTLSDRLFINVSAQRYPTSRIPGWGGDHQVILLFGTDAYRAGNLRLAVLDPSRPGVADALASRGPLPRGDLGLRYWTGVADGVPTWSAREQDARPLLHPGTFGEISVRWVPDAGRFLLLAGSGPEDPVGPAVTLRSSLAPWGPWTPRHRLLDWVARGMSHGDPAARFIKAHGDGTDPVGDRIFRLQARSTGAGYAPYLFDAKREDDGLTLRYTLSTWNPYQVVLLEHRLALGVLAAGDGPPESGA